MSYLLLECKRMLLENVTQIMCPFVFGGIANIYLHAVKSSKRNDERAVDIFRELLASVWDWPKTKIKAETDRIRQNNISDNFEEMVEIISKISIMIMTLNKCINNEIAEEFCKNFHLETFVHQCYIDCSKYAYNNPYLFLTENDVDFKKNQAFILSEFRNIITNSITKILPMYDILNNFHENTKDFFLECKVQTDPKIADDIMSVLTDKQKKDHDRPQMMSLQNESTQRISIPSNRKLNYETTEYIEKYG